VVLLVKKIRLGPYDVQSVDDGELGPNDHEIVVFGKEFNITSVVPVLIRVGDVPYAGKVRDCPPVVITPEKSYFVEEN
jgi:hypothetical protein